MTTPLAISPRPSPVVVPPSRKVKYNKRMTIVAGFVHENGVLVCSDTLLANSTNAKYGAKIFPVLFNDGRALIGFSGLEVFAQGAIEQIQASQRRRER